MRQAPGLGEGVRAGASDPPGVYVEGGPIARSLLGRPRALASSPEATRRSGGNAGLTISTPASTPSLDAVKMSWTPSSAPLCCPSHQRPSVPALIYGLGELWEAQDKVGTVVEAGVECHPSPFDPEELRITAKPPVPLRLRPRKRQRGRRPKCSRVSSTCSCAAAFAGV